MKRIAITLAVALAMLFSAVSPASASATYWKNSSVSVTYVTVQVYNNGWYYVNVQPGFAAGSAYVPVYYYKLTATFCANEYDATTQTFLQKRVGSNTSSWVPVNRKLLVYVYHC